LIADLASQLEPFIPAVIFVVEESAVVVCGQHAADDVPHVNGFGAEVEAFHDHVREHNVGQHLAIPQERRGTCMSRREKEAAVGVDYAQVGWWRKEGGWRRVDG